MISGTYFTVSKHELHANRIDFILQYNHAIVGKHERDCNSNDENEIDNSVIFNNGKINECRSPSNDLCVHLWHSLGPRKILKEGTVQYLHLVLRGTM